MPNRRTPGQEHAMNRIASGWHRLVVPVIDGEPHAQRFPDNGLQVRDFQGLLKRDGAILRKGPASDGVADDALKAGVGVRGGGVDDGGAKRVGGGVGPGEDLQVGFAFDFALGEAVADEAADHVVVGFGLVGGVEALRDDAVDDALDASRARGVGFLGAEEAQAERGEEDASQPGDVEDEEHVAEGGVDAADPADDVFTAGEVAPGLPYPRRVITSRVK